MSLLKSETMQGMSGLPKPIPGGGPPAFRRNRLVLWTLIVIALAGAWAELLSTDRLDDPVPLLALLILVITVAAAAGRAVLDILAARTTRALLVSGVVGLTTAAARQMGATTIFGAAAAAALFANCGTGSAQTTSGPWASEYASDPDGFWALAPLILALLAAGIAAPAVIAISAAALMRAGRILPEPRLTSRVRLAVLVGVFPLLAEYLVAASQIPERCSLAMGRCAAGAGGTFVAVVSLAWLPLLYFLAGTLLAAVSHDLTKKAIAE
jgi:hypothetical protein